MSHVSASISDRRKLDSSSRAAISIGSPFMAFTNTGIWSGSRNGFSLYSFSGRVTRGLRPVSSNIAAEISIHTFLIYFGDSDFASLRMAACH